MGLSFQIYASPTGTLLWDFTRRVKGLKFSDNEHGHEGCSGFVPMGLGESFAIYEHPGMPHVKIVDEGAGRVWEGRLEDREATEAGISLAAFGYWRGYGDIPYSATHTSVTANTISAALVAAVSAANSFMSSSTILIQNPGVTFDETYEDKLPSDILSRLVRLGDNQTTPRLWEAGVWEDRRLFFQPRGTVGRTWYVDVGQPRLKRTLDTLYNSSYGVYSDVSGDRAVTATATNAASVARHVVTRRAPVDASTASSALAVIARDLFIAQHKDPPPEAELPILAVFDAAGARWPKYVVRSGDTVFARNLPPTLSATIDRIRSFRVLSKTYDVDNDDLVVTPEEYYPSLESIVAEGKGSGGSDAGDKGGASGKWNTKIKLPTKKTVPSPLPGGGSREVFSTMIAMTDAASCPTGWTEYTAARGRFIVGVPSGGTVAGTVGTALANLANRTISTTATHLHAAGTLDTANESSHTHDDGSLVNAAEASHTHAVDPPSTDSGTESANHTHSADPPATNTDTESAHTHDFKGGGGGAVQVIALTTSVGTSNITGLIGATGGHNHSVNIAAFNTAIESITHFHALNIASFTSGAGASHNHVITGTTAAGTAHSHSVTGSTANTGTATVDVTMPYIQLRFCQKD